MSSTCQHQATSETMFRSSNEIRQASSYHPSWSSLLIWDQEVKDTKLALLRVVAIARNGVELACDPGWGAAHRVLRIRFFGQKVRKLCRGVYSIRQRTDRYPELESHLHPKPLAAMLGLWQRPLTPRSQIHCRSIRSLSSYFAIRISAV